MFVVVCYDVPDDRRRTKMSNILKGYGSRVQRSVFECDLTLTQLQKLKGKLSRLVTEEDGLRYYYMCAQCLAKVEVVKGPPVEHTQLYFVV